MVVSDEYSHLGCCGERAYCQIMLRPAKCGVACTGKACRHSTRRHQNCISSVGKQIWCRRNKASRSQKWDRRKRERGGVIFHRKDECAAWGYINTSGRELGCRKGVHNSHNSHNWRINLHEMCKSFKDPAAPLVAWVRAKGPAIPIAI